MLYTIPVIYNVKHDWVKPQYKRVVTHKEGMDYIDGVSPWATQRVVWEVLQARNSMPATRQQCQ